MILPTNKIALLASMAITLACTNSYADSFHRISTWSTASNLPKSAAIETETSAEIITASSDGKTLIYSDSPLGGIGFIDISDEKLPKALGFLQLDGEPTSVAASKKYVLAGVNTSKNFTSPSGKLTTINIQQQRIVGSCDLGGQPDSVAVSKDNKYVAIAIENERDEDLNDGLLPQLPAGNLVIAPLKNGKPNCEQKTIVSLNGLAEIGPTDPEPEFVDFNNNNEIVLTLQENNHIVVISAKDGKITNHFSAGSVDLKNIDTEEERALTFDGQQSNRKREPDAVKWIDNDRFITANEGDYEGGSRSFTIFNKNGKVLFESGLDLEYRIVRAGHYPEKRSGNKGVEPEGIEVARFSGNTYLFVLAERSGIVGVYKDTGGKPEFVQLLPAGVAPEGAIAIPERNLLAVANEKDLIEDNGPRSHVMLYQLSDQEPNYPHIESISKKERPIGWGALSGLVADDKKPGILYAVNDSFYKEQPTIFTINANKTPAKITKATIVTKYGSPAKNLDMEGITTDGKGGFWIASEGNSKKSVPHAIYHVSKTGEIKEEILFPKELLKHEIRFGAEGITRIGDTLWIAIQRPWKDDPKNMTKLVSYDTNTKQWSAVHYPLDTVKKGWVGLSEISAHEGYLYIVERDNNVADAAEIKRLYRVSQKYLSSSSLPGKLPIVKKELAYDFIPKLQSFNGYIAEKLEGFTFDRNGNAFAITDNDGVDDNSGETLFFNIEKIQ